MNARRNEQGTATAAGVPFAGDAGVAAGVQLTLSVGIKDATDNEIDDITRELNRWIREAGPSCEVAPVTVLGSGKEKGLLAVLGTLGLKFLEPSALKALIDCLAVYIKERRRQVIITLQAASGATVKIDAGGIGRGELEMLLRDAGHLLEPPRTLPHT